MRIDALLWWLLAGGLAGPANSGRAVSYTHLDVYKRQVQGWASLLDGKTVEVESADGNRLRIQCEHLLLAAGSEPTPLPSVPFGGMVMSSTEALLSLIHI